MKVSLLAVFSMLLISCSYQKAAYSIDDLNSGPAISLTKWNYIILKDNHSNEKLNLDKDYLKSAGITSEAEFSKSLVFNEYSGEDLSSNKIQRLQGYKNSKEPIIDFKEIDTLSLTGSAIYMYCNIESSQQQTGYIMSRSVDGLKLWVNGNELLKTDENRGFEQYFSDFVRIHLKKGDNQILLKKVVNNPDLVMEVQLANFKIASNEYKKNANGLVFNKAIIQDTAKLKDNHAKCFKTVICYNFRDIHDKIVYKTIKYPTGSDSIITASLKDGSAYMCSFKLGNEVISGPLFKGNPDDYFKKRNADILTLDNGIRGQIAPYLYRLDKLLKHESRKSDWWWSFKVADLIYEIENLIANSKNKRQSDLTFGIRLNAYTSTLDSSTQHYLLITPDSLHANEKIPLVLVLRPFIENHQHFLTSPQMSRYWGLLWAKNLANKYRYIIVMPSARLYGNEPMTPMAESEIFQVIKDISKYYNIDKDRVYLHGNCSAGFRSLVLAEHHPFTFAAIGLYAPVVYFGSDDRWILQNSPGENISKLKNIPMFLHFDPLDTHNPYSEFQDFIAECNSRNLPLQVSSALHSGLHYNVQLVGEETLAFFKNKKRNSNNSIDSANTDSKKKGNPVILDFFSKPFLYVANYKDSQEHGLTAQIKEMTTNEYEQLLFAPCPIKYDTQITLNDLRTKNIFFIGHTFNNKYIMDKLRSIPLAVAKDGVKLNTQMFQGKNITFEAIFRSPFNPQKYIIVYSTNSNLKFEQGIAAPWRSGFNNQVVLNANE